MAKTDKERFEELTYKKESMVYTADKGTVGEAMAFCEGYKVFLDKGKTERECVRYATRLAEECGFKTLDSVKGIKAGDKVYAVNNSKGIMLAVIGKQDIDNGVLMVGAHIDSPRFDLKPRPLFEDADMAWLKTQYYGGIKKYQWLTLPLAMHGIICKADGTSVDICIGEKADDPVFVITDLLPHLSQDMMQKQVMKAFNADNFHVLCGSLPKGDDDIKEKIKFAVMCYLNENYGIVEEDFISAEIELVPCEKARDIGFDRGMIGAYGQDDRVCGYGALEAVLELARAKAIPEKTAMCLLVDKEEIGSMGMTGMKSRFFEKVLSEIADKANGGCDAKDINTILANSCCLSADVGAAYDPQYPEVMDKGNSAICGGGVQICKYTGGRGKSDSSDANAEFVAKVRKIFDENGVVWQTGELGKVDVGGGGTIAQYVANLGLNVLDCGTALLCMHAPFEISSKMDVYMTYKAYHAFFLKY